MIHINNIAIITFQNNTILQHIPLNSDNTMFEKMPLSHITKKTALTKLKVEKTSLFLYENPPTPFVKGGVRGGFSFFVVPTFRHGC